MSNIVKNTTFPTLLSLLAPHSCRGCGALGEPLCDCCKNYIISHHQNLCPNCKSPKAPFQPSQNLCSNCPDLPPTFVVGPRDGLLGDLIYDLKFNSVHALARPLAETLNQILPIPQEPTIIIPLPTITKHIRKRGLDHTYLIAKHLARLHPNYTVKKLLIRAKNTIQVGSDADTRKAQATSAYTLAKTAIINSTTPYLLLDDVWTTGASMRAAHQILHHAGAENVTLAILALSTFDH